MPHVQEPTALLDAVVVAPPVKRLPRLAESGRQRPGGSPAHRPQQSALAGPGHRRLSTGTRYSSGQARRVRASRHATSPETPPRLGCRITEACLVPDWTGVLGHPGVSRQLESVGVPSPAAAAPSVPYTPAAAAPWTSRRASGTARFSRAGLAWSLGKELADAITAGKGVIRVRF